MVKIPILKVGAQTGSFFSVALDTSLRFEIGRKQEYSSWSTDAFLNAASLNLLGTTASSRDKFSSNVCDYMQEVEFRNNPSTKRQVSDLRYRIYQA